jgi:hypothetical protein
MVNAPSLRAPVSAAALAVLLAGCADGGNNPNTSFVTSFPQPTAPTGDPTTPPATSTDGSSGEGGPTGDPGGDPATTTPVDPTTGNVDPSTTAPDPSTTNVDPSTTNVDPSTTNVDPSTTNVDPSTTNAEVSSGDPPDPPGNDPQPNTGLYEHCVDPDTCDAPANVCLQLNDAMMNIVDGYCTKLCQNVADCGVPPDSQAVQECYQIDAMNKICGLKCTKVADCPTGMQCINLALPNNQSGFYCI